MKKGERIVSHIGGIPVTYEATGETNEHGHHIVIMLSMGSTAQQKPTCELIKIKGSGEWHACVLKNRVWTGVSPHFKNKACLRRWVEENGFEVVKS